MFSPYLRFLHFLWHKPETGLRLWILYSPEIKEYALYFPRVRSGDLWQLTLTHHPCYVIVAESPSPGEVSEGREWVLSSLLTRVYHSCRQGEHNKWISYSGKDAGAFMSFNWDSETWVPKVSENGQNEASAKIEYLITKKAQDKMDDAGLNGKICQQKRIFIFFSFSDVSNAFWQCESH